MISRFDRLVWTVLLGLLLMIGGLVWRGDRVGLRVVEISPAGDTTQVSTRPVLQITFDQPIQPNRAIALTADPVISGTIRWQGNSLIFVPAQLLESDSDYTITIPAGLQSQSGRALLNPLRWSFHTGRGRLLYIAKDAQAVNQLFAITPGQSNPTQLTNEPFDVLDYALSPDATTLAYSVNNEIGGSDLWAMTTDGRHHKSLLLCAPNATCNAPTWSPDGQQLIYERRSLFGPAIPPGPPRLWWYDWQNSNTTPLFQDSQFISLAATFSADGQWLAYIAPTASQIQAYDLRSGRTVIVTSHMGEPGVWNPAAANLLITEVQFSDQSGFVHIFAVDLNDGRLSDLSGSHVGSDQSPTWSPDGQTIAFVRQMRDSSPAGQLWLMNADGSQATMLTNEPDIHHSQPSWSPDGRYLAFRRYNLKEAGSEPALWLLDLQTGQFQEIVQAAVRPGWLP